MGGGEGHIHIHFREEREKERKDVEHVSRSPLFWGGRQLPSAHIVQVQGKMGWVGGLTDRATDLCTFKFIQWCLGKERGGGVLR